jgi:hypothetical protein
MAMLKAMVMMHVVIVTVGGMWTCGIVERAARVF